MDLHGIDLNLLVAFDALMAERSVTRAGARIGRTQPAMSAALARLRALLEDELFVRGAAGLQPTPRALDLARPISQALEQIQGALAFTQSFAPSTSSVSLTLGLSEHPAFRLLPQLLASLGLQAPGVTLNVRSFVRRDDAIAMLDAGEVDLTVGVSPTPTARLLSAPLFRERFVCILRKDHPVASGPLDLDRFLALSHLLVSPENERYGVVDAALSKTGLKRRLGLTLPQMYAAPALVASSDMIATVMHGVVSASGYRDHLAVLQPPLELEEVPFLMTWHRRNDSHPGQRWFRDCLVTAAASLTPAPGESAPDERV